MVSLLDYSWDVDEIRMEFVTNMTCSNLKHICFENVICQKPILEANVVEKLLKNHVKYYSS